MAELSSRIRGVKRALRALGRWSWTRPTPGRGVETFMYSYVADVAGVVVD